MKTLTLSLLLAFALLPSSRAEEARFFRLFGPVASTITVLRSDGYVTWTNVPTNAIFTVQTAASLFGPTHWVDYVQVPVTTAVTTHQLVAPYPPAGMAFIPAGSFTMGDTFNEGLSVERPTHTVYVSAFYMDRTEVTKAMWDEVYQWATNRPVELRYSFDNLGSWSEGVNRSKGQNHPVHVVNWYDCVKWCNARSEKEGRVPAYYTNGEQTAVYRSGQLDLLNDWVKWDTGYRLPTEAEWEKAARGGASGQRFPWGNTIDHSRANYRARAQVPAYDVNPTDGFHPMFGGVQPYTSPAGYFAPNGYGLYDMVGNVWEWCWDRWSNSYYSSSPSSDPRGPVTGPTSGPSRVFRGGLWGSIAFDCRLGHRTTNVSTIAADELGFRAVLPPGQ